MGNVDVAVLGAVRSGGPSDVRRRLRVRLIARLLAAAWIVTGTVWLPGWQALTAAAVGAVVLAALQALGAGCGAGRHGVISPRACDCSGSGEP
jgi:hypothetical protein